MQIERDAALRLLNRYRLRIGQKQSWRAVQRHLAKAGHPNAFLVSGQKLANWANPKRGTRLADNAFEAVIHFIQTPEFQERVPETKKHLDQSGRAIEAGVTVTELSGIYPVEETEFILFKALEGMWCDRQNLVYLHIHKVDGHNFAIVHLCQKIPDGYKSALGFPIKQYADFLASGFLYFENETHSKNKDKFQENASEIGQIEPFGDSSNTYRIGVSGKKMHLKLWSDRKRYEANFEASCHCSFRDSMYEPTIDGSASVSNFFAIRIHSNDSDEIYSFDRANDAKADGLIWNERAVKDVNILKEEFDENKWSVLPNAIS